jgi:electron transport complex protein RnfA
MWFSLFASILAAMLVSNVVLQGFGLEITQPKSIRLKPTLITTTLIALLSLIVFLVDYLLYTYVLVPGGFEYFNLLFLAVLVVGITELYLFVSNKLKFDLPKSPTVGLQTIILVVGLVLSNQSTFGEAFVFAFGALLGYIGFAILFTTLASRMRVAPLTKAFKGLPIALIILGLIALIFTGLGGIL